MRILGHIRRAAAAATLAGATLTGVTLPATPAHAVFPGEGNRILFARGPAVLRGGQDTDLFSVDELGLKKQRLSDSPNMDEFPAHWSPTGARVLYLKIHASDGSYGIWIAKADGSGRHEVPFGSGIALYPAWSPSGDRIVFSKITGGAAPVGRLGLPRGVSSSLVTMNDDGTGRRTLLEKFVIGPAYSPNGNRIAYSRLRDDGSYEIHTIKINGSGVRRLTDFGVTTLFGDWSPDGDRIVFLRMPPLRGGAGNELWTMNDEGGHRRMIADNVSTSSLPQYTADGKRILFARSPGDGPTDLYSIRVDGTGLRRITNTPSDSEYLGLVSA